MAINVQLDPFCLTGPKVAFLLNIKHSSNVLLIGCSPTLFQDFKLFFEHCTTLLNASQVKPDIDIVYDLIIWNSASENYDIDVTKTLNAIHELLKQNGHFVFIANNKYSLKNLKHIILERNDRNNTGRQLCLTLFACKGLLKTSGLYQILQLLPMPDISVLNELLVTSSIFEKMESIPAYFHPILKLANTFRLYHLMHNSYLFLASPGKPLNLLHFVAKLNLTITQIYKPGGRVKLRLTRFDLRKRGALLLFFQEIDFGKAFVVRVAVTPAIQKRINQNGDKIKKLIAYAGMTEKIKKKLPYQLISFKYHEQFVYVEEKIRGVLAYTISNNKRLRLKVTHEIIEFIEQIHLLTRKSVHINEALIELLVRKDIKLLLKTFDKNDIEIKKVLDSISSFLENKLFYKICFTVFSHGDYSYGNILVDSQTGLINGVIDWDCARETELQGIDLINFLIQKNRIEKKMLFAAALQDVLQHISQNNSILFATAETMFSRKEQHDILLILTCLRFVAREALYPAGFSEAYEECRNGLIWAQKLIEK